jgi:hypothetical protein
MYTLGMCIDNNHNTDNTINTDNTNNKINTIETYDGKISTVTKAECGTECTINSNCSGFAYRPLTGTCYLSEKAILGEPINSVYLDEYSKLDARCNKINKISDEDAVNDSTLTQNSLYQCQDGEKNRSELFQYANFGSTSLENSAEHTVRDQAVNENSRPQPVRYELTTINYPDSEVYGPVQTRDIFGNKLNLYRDKPKELEPHFTTLSSRINKEGKAREVLQQGDPTDSTNMGDAPQPQLLTDINLDKDGETQTSFVTGKSGATMTDADGMDGVSGRSVLAQPVNNTIPKNDIDNVNVDNVNDVNNIVAVEGFEDNTGNTTTVNNKAFVESDKEFLGQYMLNHQCVVNVPQYDCLKFCENSEECAGVEWNKTITRFDETTGEHSMYENVCCPKTILKQMIPRRKEYRRGRFYIKVDKKDIPERDTLTITRQNFKDMFNSHIKNNDKFQLPMVDTRRDIYDSRQQDTYSVAEPLTESGGVGLTSHGDKSSKPIGYIPVEHSNIKWWNK